MNPYPRRWQALWVLFLALAVINMDSLIVNVALPTLVRDLLLDLPAITRRAPGTSGLRGSRHALQDAGLPETVEALAGRGSPATRPPPLPWPAPGAVTVPVRSGSSPRLASRLAGCGGSVLQVFR